MHLFLVILVLLFALLKGDWKNWEEYYPTMLYISLASFLYEYISHSHYHLWELREVSFLSPLIIHKVHNLIINPLLAFIFLSNYPTQSRKQVTYMGKWIIAFSLGEFICSKMGLLTYHNGWNFGWSAFFVLLMFPMIRLHHINKLRALILSLLWTLFFLVIFDYI